MAGFGKSSRQGKRGSSSSSSSYAPTVTMVVFVAVCLLAVWMLTSSSVPPSQAAKKTTHLSGASRAFLRDPPPATMDDSPGDLSEDAIKGDNDPSAEEEPEEDKLKMPDVTSRSGDGDQDSHGAEVASKSESKVGEEFEENQQHPQPQRQAEEETPQNEQDGGDEKGEHNLEQEEHDSDGTTDGSQLQEESSGQQEQESDDDRRSEEQQTGSDGEGNQQDSQEEQQQESRGDGEGEQQQSQSETEESENQTPQEQTEEGSSEGSQSQSEEQREDGGDGSQSQPDEQTDTGEDQQQQQQTEETAVEETQQQSEEKLSDPNAGDSIPDEAQSEVSNEGDGKKRPWATQADHSDNEKERRREETQPEGGDDLGSDGNGFAYEWELCNVTAGPHYIPCLDNQKAIKKLHSLRHFEHRERHCPEEPPTCLVPLPKGYKQPIEWPKSRDRIWYNNVPFTKLAEVKGHQNWVKITGQFLTFPGGGTQFIHGALHYIDFLQQAVSDIAWGKHTRVILDVGCGVASFGGYLFERDVLAMSFAPKDEHEAQIQFALERGIPAISAVMGSQRLQFPSRVFDIVHCARCRVPWHAEGGTLLLELNRVLRPGGYFVWSATPVYQKLKEDVEIWKAMASLTKSMCWELVTIKKDKLNSVGAAIYRKPITNECYDSRKQDSPPMCKGDDDPNAAWYIPLQTCMHRVPVHASERGSHWPEAWPRRAEVPPYWLNRSQIGVYGKPATEDFVADYEHWKHVVKKSYLSGLGISWSRVRNVMDMRAVYGGFAAALKDLKLWVMNVVNIDSPDTLPIIYERGLFGIYHDWCESFSTYPRSYDLLHADHLFSRLKKRCNIVPVMAEVDRIVRPGGKLIVRDESAVVSEVENLLKSLHWEVRLTFSKAQEGILCAEKSKWRPEKYTDSS